MNRVYVVVEGQTEQTFIRDVLAPDMAKKNIFLYPALIGKPGHKGGDVRFDRAREDIGKFLAQGNDTFVSTMVDYFKIDSAWPGCDSIKHKSNTGTIMSATEKAKLINQATHDEISKQFSANNAKDRFISYIEMHEFEALLFSDAKILASKLQINVGKIQTILDQYDNPEEINTDPVYAPSKRLEKLKYGYRKVAMGKEISEAIGIRKIREMCPNFDCWISQLENLSKR